MPPTEDLRYRPVSPLRHADDRSTWFAHDVLTGRAVFVKGGRLAAVRREASVLLRLPEGVSARVADIVRGGGGLVLCQERLRGRTFLEAAPAIDLEAGLPGVVAATLRSLEGLHATGYVHADLKPSNLFLLDGTQHPDVRLLDLGYAWGLAAPAADTEGVLLGGTPPFVAPEIVRGWAVDGRADLYSLGMTVRALWPDAENRAEWRAILEKLCDRSPSRRFPTARAAAEEIVGAFRGSAFAPAWIPRFAWGPLRGRDRELRETLALVRGAAAPATVLVQARPHTGLTRFLLEAVLATDAGDPPVRAIDLGAALAHGAGAAAEAAAGAPGRGTPGAQAGAEEPSGGPPGGAGVVERFAGLLEESAGRGESVLLGVPDPSPSLGWPGRGLPEDLLDRLRALRAPRVRLRRLDLAALQEVVASSLGHDLPIAAALTRRLDAGADGDLESTAEGFEMVLAAVSPGEPVTSWDERRIAGALHGWPSAPPGPALDDFPAALRRPAETAARAGAEARAELVRRLLHRFAPEGALEALLDAGILEPAGAERLAFTTRRLWTDALASGEGTGRAADVWLHEEFVPAARDTFESMEAADRARRLGDFEGEARILSAALESAAAEHRWTHIRAILGYPSMPHDGLDDVAVGDPEAVLDRLAALRSRLCAGWTRARVLHLAGRTLYMLGEPGGLGLLERAAEETDDSEAVDALLLLVYWLRTAGRMADAAPHWARLEVLEREARGPAPGVMELERGRRAFFLGQKDDAERHAREAVRLLEGSGLIQEVGSLMFLAVLKTPDEPEEAERLLTRALAIVRQRDVEVMIHWGLSQFHETRGDLAAFEKSAQAACDALDGYMSYRHHSACRLQRAWAWALVDRAREAEAEAASLLQLAPLRAEKPRFVTALSLAGFCALHRGDGRSAVSQMAFAWSQTSESSSVVLRSAALRYLLDALLDTRAWDVVAEYGDVLDLGRASDHPIARLTAARCTAIREQAAGRWASARAALAERLPDVGGHKDRLDVARFHHHLGALCLEGAAERAREAAAAGVEARSPEAARLGAEAAERFAAALAVFGSSGYGYFRSRSLVGLARAEELAGRSAAARRTLEDAIALARRCACLGVLAEGLVDRASLQIASV